MLSLSAKILFYTDLISWWVKNTTLRDLYLYYWMYDMVNTYEFLIILRGIDLTLYTQREYNYFDDESFRAFQNFLLE